MTQTKNMRVHLTDDEWTKLRIAAALKNESVTEYLSKFVHHHMADLEDEISAQTKLMED